MKSVQTWLDEYGVSHTDTTNKLIHWVCVPAIMLSLLGLLSGVRMRSGPAGTFVNLASVVVAASVLYYAALSIPLAVGMLVIGGAAVAAVAAAWTAHAPVLWISIALFAAAWVGQFIGHKIEGAKPSFFKDLQFLLIGPIWLLSAVYRKLGIRY